MSGLRVLNEVSMKKLYHSLLISGGDTALISVFIKPLKEDWPKEGNTKQPRHGEQAHNCPVVPILA